MEPSRFRRRISADAMIAFIVGVVVAFVLQWSMQIGGGRLLTIIIVAGVGGLWYKLRNVA